MTTLMKLMNGLLTRLFDAICWPFQGLNPIWAMIVISLLTGLLMLWIFGKVSNQEAIRRIKDKIRGNLIAVRLYQNDIRVVLRVQARILRDTLTYMKYSVVPMLVIIVPVVFIIIQLNLRFSVRALQPGEQTLVKIKLRDASALHEEVVLEAPEGVKVETPGVRIEAEREVSWRIRAEQPGFYRIVIRTGNESVEKELIVGSGWGAVSALRTGKSLSEMLLYPGEAPIHPFSVIQSVQVNYPSLSMPIFGWNIHWLILFFVLSVVFGFAFKGVFGVQV